MQKIRKFPNVPIGDKRSSRWSYLKAAKKMDKFIGNNDVVYDCGANIFDHSIFLANSNPLATIVAFEPIKDYFNMGLKNIEYFNIKNIIPMNIALGDTREKMQISVHNEGSSLVFEHQNSNTETITVETIDYLVENNKIPAPNVIKIDVEGFALPLLRGARETIKKFRPIVIIEIHPQFVGDKEAREKIQILQGYGLNIVEELSMGSEFIMAYSAPKVDFEWVFSISRLRSKYDKSKNKLERKQISQEYKILKSGRRVPFLKLLLWSKLYIFFTFKWLK